MGQLGSRCYENLFGVDGISLVLLVDKTFIIGEAGVNHNGDSNLAFQLIDIAANAGVDAVKFQTFDVHQLVSASAPKAAYQSTTTDPRETQLEMLSRLQLDHNTFRDLQQYAEKKNLIFLSTAFDLPSLNFLVNELKLDLLKVPSGEITNGPLLLEYARSGCTLIVSTGMSTLREVRTALSVLAFGFTSSGVPSQERFLAAYESEEGKKSLIDRVILLHCTTEYPAPLDSVNLRAMVTMREIFGLRVGYSDHTISWEVPCAAVALGGHVIEKHFTLDRALPGPDHAASLQPDELRKMVTSIRSVEEALGNLEKQPQEIEYGNRNVARKSLVATSRISAGEEFSESNIGIKRPGMGRSPMDYWEILGSISPKSYEPDEFI